MVQNQNQLDKALRRIALVAVRPTPAVAVIPGVITEMTLKKHAVKYGGTEAVLYTGWQAGVKAAALLRLATELEDLRVDKAAGKWSVKHMTKRQVEKQLEKLEDWL